MCMNHIRYNILYECTSFLKQCAAVFRLNSPPKFLAEPSGKAERGGARGGLNKGLEHRCQERCVLKCFGPASLRAQNIY